jgi:hypothetical protein
MRYPFAPLAAAMGMTPAEAARSQGISGSTWKQYRDEGMSRDVADRRAVRAGFHPWTVWPEMAEHDMAAADALEEELRERRRAQLTAATRRYRQRHPHVRAYNRERRRAYYEQASEYEKARERRRYWENRDAILERKRELRRQQRDDEVA